MGCEARDASGTLRLSGLVSDSIVDGPGLRLAIFTQGCTHGCKGCHNPASHDPAGGYELPISDILMMLEKNPLLSGITLTGGEPMEQAPACLALVRALPAGLNVWVYTGYTYEQILQSGEQSRVALAHAADVLVDGPFVQAERSLNLSFRGSRNQRLIDIKKTLAKGTVALFTASVW